jgi:dTDP-4-amino-4,6-dideoxygalactose transaminase
MKFRVLAPAGTPIPWRYFFYILPGLFRPQKSLEKFREKICSNFGVKYCFFMNTGRAAMTMILKSLFELNGGKRNEVIIPSYTCYSVPASVIKAGLRIRIADIDPDTLSLDLKSLEKIEMGNVLAIVATSLYGLPNDLPKLQKFAESREVFLIDDAAQSMGARVNNHYCGTFGVAGLYSLDKGKNLTTLNGGIIVTNHDRLAEIIRNQLKQLKKPSLISTFIQIIKLLIYKIFLHPVLYGIPNRIPALNLGKTVYDETFALERYPAILAGLGCGLFKNLDKITQIRTVNAHYYLQHLPEANEIREIKVMPDSHPAYLRFPVRLTDGNLRNRLFKILSERGISTSYPEAIPAIPEIQTQLVADHQKTENGQLIARQILSLPTHPYVTQKDMDSIINTFGDNLH